MRLLARIGSALAIVWLLAAGALFAAMKLPPGRFCSVIAHVPTPLLMMTMPFQRLWMIARAGSLSPGDRAPDFDLPRQDNSGRVKLSSSLGRPVVLIFGSYT
ncbi:MAG: hypothetical protein IT167_01110 [Bryobacterales bacterium]|nr:hypothetical protein [Bryobacterales bacterium]